MSIVSSQIAKIRNRGNGTLAVLEHHTDHTGAIHEHHYFCDEDYDTNQALIEWATKINESLISDEEDSVQSQIENGVDPSSISTNHLNNRQRRRRVIRALMRGNPRKLLKAAEFVQSLSNTQIESIFSQAKRARIRARQNYILNNQAVINDDIREEI